MNSLMQSQARAQHNRTQTHTRGKDVVVAHIPCACGQTAEARTPHSRSNLLMALYRHDRLALVALADAFPIRTANGTNSRITNKRNILNTAFIMIVDYSGNIQTVR